MVKANVDDVARTMLGQAAVFWKEKNIQITLLKDNEIVQSTLTVDLAIFKKIIDYYYDI